MISLKRILQDGGAGEQPLLRALHLLLQGMGQHAIEGDGDDLAALRGTIANVIAVLSEDIEAADLLVHTGSALHSLEDYNRRTARYLKRPCGEWQAVVTMLTSAMASMALAGEEHTRRLREIGASVRAANSTEEVHKIRLQLSACLAEIQLETKYRGSGDASAAGRAPDITTTPAAVADPVTGFASRAQAEEALGHGWQADPPLYVAVMVLDRLVTFNARFGHAVGDEVLRYFGGFLRGNLRSTDQIFRWSDHTLVAALSRASRIEIVRDEVGRMMDSPCDHTVQTASRTILLPISARWTVFPSTAAPRLLIHKIDAFAAMKTVRAGDAELETAAATPAPPNP